MKSMHYLLNQPPITFIQLSSSFEAVMKGISAKFLRILLHYSSFQNFWTHDSSFTIDPRVSHSVPGLQFRVIFFGSMGKTRNRGISNPDISADNLFYRQILVVSADIILYKADNRLYHIYLAYRFNR